MKTGKLRLVSVDSNGVKGGNDSTHPAISTDGRFIAFQSAADDWK